MATRLFGSTCGLTQESQKQLKHLVLRFGAQMDVVEPIKRLATIFVL